jgi:outer membrane protein assembly factor BamD
MKTAIVPTRTAWHAWRAAVLGAVCALALAACGGKKDDDKNYVERPVDTLYNIALDALGAGSYVTAAKGFEEVDRQHPYSVWATKAQIMAAFSYYQANKYDDAIVALDRFIQLHPGHRDIAYAYYLKALCYYEQIADVGRDQRITELALNALADVAKRFPETGYARDARLKVDLAVDHLGGKEMDVGRFYQKQRQYVAAVNRYRQVLEKYQTTTHTPEALHRLVECYLALGVQQEAKMAAAVLGHNFPGSDWYADTYYLLEGVDLRPERSERSWLNRIWKSIF